MTYKDTHPRQSLTLSPEQWAALDALAADLAGPAPKGRTAGSPSWRTLIRDIANGRLEVVSVQPLIIYLTEAGDENEITDFLENKRERYGVMLAKMRALATDQEAQV